MAKQQTHKKHTTFQLFTGNEYFQVLLENIQRAKKRIVLASMSVLWGTKTEPILTEIKRAAARGVRVQILLDNYTKLAFGTPASKDKANLKKTLSVLSDLENKGATVHFVGKLGLNPFKGRCHIKITVVDDECYTFGGVNFTDYKLDADYMLHTRNAELADYLERLVTRIAAHPKTLLNEEIPINSNTFSLFDGGRPKQSIIYNTACILAANAKKVYFVSQMVPSGELARILNQTSAVFYFNRPDAMSIPDRWGQAFDQQRYRIPNDYTGSPYIHAKFMLFEMPNGERHLITGSNNFSYRGVAYGTQEIALHSTDKGLWQQLYTFLREHIQ